MGDTGGTEQKVWVLYEYVDAEGHTTCDVMKVFGNAEAALAGYLEITVDDDAGKAEARARLERGEFVEFGGVHPHGDCLLELVPFVGPMSGGRSRRKRKTTRRNK